MRFEVGDKVRVREDLDKATLYGRYAGTIVTVKNTLDWAGFYVVEEIEIWFNENMLEPISDPLVDKIEVKKDIEWLNNEVEKRIKKIKTDEVSFAGSDYFDEGYIHGMRDVQSIANQLDEPENKYYVVDNKNRNLLYKHNNNVMGELEASYRAPTELVESQLTEQEIKDYDPRYLAFVKPVEEEL